jgi:hypothetical protein
MDGLSSRRWWQRAWLWGLLITVAIALASALGQSTHWQLTIVLVLATLALTTLVEIYAAVESNHSQLDQARRSISLLQQTASRLSPLATAPAPFRDFVEHVARNQRKIETDGHRFLHIMARTLQEEFQEAVQSIAEGHIEIDANAAYSFRSASLGEFRLMRMVHVRGLDFWESRPGIAYLERQRHAVREGRLSVERVFVLSSGQVSAAREIIFAQIEAGIRVLVVINDQKVSHQIARYAIDMGIVEDVNGARMVVRLGTGTGDHGIVNAEREVLSRRAIDVETAIRHLDILCTYAVPITDIYPDLTATQNNIQARSGDIA